MVKRDVMQCFAYSALSYNSFGPARTFQEVLRSFDDEGLSVTAFSPRLRYRPDNGVRQVQGLPIPFRYLPWKYVGTHGAQLTENRLVAAALRESGRRCIYTFPDLSIESHQRLRDAGVCIVREMTNLHRGTARRILSQAFEEEGLPPYTEITAKSVEVEQKCLEYSDYVFAPNAEVADSLTEFGVAPDRILDTSYGWSRSRYPSLDMPRDKSPAEAVALYVGRVSYEKGVHYLLRAWHRAGTPGKLVLAGAMDPLLESRMADELAHPSIERLGFVKNMSEVYASADYFVFPSLVEGGPQVVYEAAAHGLAPLVSPKGAGRMIADADHGVIVEPSNIDEFAEAITRFASDRELTERIGKNARKRAARYEWAEVSKERARLIMQAVGSN